MLSNTRMLTVLALLCAVGVATSHLLAIPVAGAKVFPVQHAINVVAAVLLGPGPAVLAATVIAILRNLLGIGTLLAFPGGIIGALLAGLAYRYFRRVPAAMLGELVGTGLLGALASYPVAALLMGRQVAVYAFVIPFASSSLAGVILGGILAPALLSALRSTGWRLDRS